MKPFLSGILFLTLSIAQAQTPMSLAALKDSVKKIMDKNHIPGVMLSLVNKDSVIWVGGMGVADREKKTPVTGSTLFRVGSISKSFTALAILKLIEQKKFNLNSKLADLAPEIPFQNKWESESPVRVVNLLEHTAGFDDIHPADFTNEEGKSKTTLSQALAHKHALYARWKPGTCMSYSNPGYAILGYLVEKYSGNKYEDYVKENIFSPVGMNHSNFDYVHSEPYATGYSYGDDYVRALPISINGNAAGAVSSCAMDMAKYVRLYLNEGLADTARVFSPGLIHEMEFTHSTLAAAAGLATGYGLANYSKMIGNDVKEVFRGHGGHIDGFISDFGYSRKWGVGYAISNNGDKSNEAFIPKILEYLLQGQASSLPVPVKLNRQEVDEFQGTYLVKTNRQQLFKVYEDLFSTSDLFVKNDTLYYQEFMETAEPWIPMSGNQFRKKDAMAATAILIHDGETKAIFSGTEFLIKVNPIGIWSLRVAIGLSLALGLLLVPFSLVWLVMTFFKKLSVREFFVRIMPLMAFLCLALMLFMLFNLSASANARSIMSKFNGPTLSIFFFGLLLPFFSVLSVYNTIRKFKTIRSTFVKYFILLSSVGCCVLSVYLFQYGWIGLRIWVY